MDFEVIPLVDAREVAKRNGGRRFKGDQADLLDRSVDVQVHLTESVKKEEAVLLNDVTAETEYAAVHRELVDLGERLRDIARRYETAGGLEWIIRRELLLAAQSLDGTLDRFAKAQERDRSDDSKQAAQIVEHEEISAAVRRTCIKFSKKAGGGDESKRDHQKEEG